MVTVISKPLADQLFPNADAAEAIGKRLTFGADEKTPQTLTIVGVTGDFPTSQMSAERAQLLLPLAQHPAHDAGNSARLYVDGALLVIRKVSTLVGVHRGLDTVLELTTRR